MSNPFRPKFPDPLPIERIHEDELNIAIQDLEKRGFVLVARGRHETDKKLFNYNQNTRGRKMSFAGDVAYGKYWAHMKKVEVKI